VFRDGDAGMMADAVAERYHVSGSWVRLLKQRRPKTREIAQHLWSEGRAAAPRIMALFGRQAREMHTFMAPASHVRKLSSLWTRSRWSSTENV
jgi:hypothetical protein